MSVSELVYAEDYLVSDQQAYIQTVQKLKPGDNLILADGVWNDFQIAFHANGTVENPITLRAENFGKVLISGQSNLKISGSHIVVKGLVFKNGYSPTRELVSFQGEEGVFASHVRFTENVIEDFNKPVRSDIDNWIALYGQYNQIDHNYIAGKTNKGPSLVVRLGAELSQKNYHKIEYNYFGHRPPLGGNGGETIRVGTSFTSRTESHTHIYRNYFDRCNGEVEIISNKSEYNLISENVFFESKGSVVFRHGGHNEISRNVFIGNGVADTGGIRVINNDQLVKDNYLEGLTGGKFLGALVVMNGVPNSPQNRYHQVDNALIKNNSFVDVQNIGFGVGSDEERSAKPSNTRFENNLILSKNDSLIGIFDDIDGIKFEGNVSAQALTPANIASQKDLALVKADNGLRYPKQAPSVGAPLDLKPIGRAATGPSWYAKPAQKTEKVALAFTSDQVNSFIKTVTKARHDYTITLAPGIYELPSALKIKRSITLSKLSGSDGQVILRSQNGSVFELLSGADLNIVGIDFQQHSADAPVFMAASSGEYDGAYDLALSKVSVEAFGEKNGPLLKASNLSFANSIEIDGLTIDGWHAPVLDLSGRGLEGWYLADNVSVVNSVFKNITGPLASFGREGRDESTFGPRFYLDHSVMEKVETVLDIHGIDGFSLQENLIVNSGDVSVKQRVLGLPFVISKNKVLNSKPIQILDINGDAYASSVSGNGQ